MRVESSRTSMWAGHGPVMAPADDYVATGERMAVVAEIAALKFKFEVHALPALGRDLPSRSFMCFSSRILGRFPALHQFAGFA